MPRSLVMTIIGPDRPGLVDELAATVAEHGGNWLESRMAQLGGHFAGILRAECGESDCEALLAALRRLEELEVHAEPEIAREESGRKQLSFDVMGNDRPGIVKQLAAVLAGAGANVEELSTHLESAPHAGHPVFRATGVVSVAKDVDEADLVSTLESLSDDLSVSVTA